LFLTSKTEIQTQKINKSNNNIYTGMMTSKNKNKNKKWYSVTIQKLSLWFNNKYKIKSRNGVKSINFSFIKNYTTNNKISKNIGSYLAGLIEGDGTFAVHNKTSIIKKYQPMIIIVFKKGDLPLANYLCLLTNCGKIYIKPERGYIYWQISDIEGVYKISCIINGYMRTPKHDALIRVINWLNDYINKNKNSNFIKTKEIINQINIINPLPLDNSPIDSNNWLTGFVDADGNFSIIVSNKSKKHNARIATYFRLEIRQNYIIKSNSNSIKNLDIANIQDSHSFYFIMIKIATFFGVNLNSRQRIIKDKTFYSYILTCSNKDSLKKVIEYFNKFPLKSSKHLDYLDWCKLVEGLSKEKASSSTILFKANEIKRNFNKTRYSFNWDHLQI
jgi:Uri superfamily endonuclease